MKNTIGYFVTVGALISATCSTQATITLDKINSLSTGLGEASAEIISYDKNSQKLFVINSGHASFSIFDFSLPAAPSVGTIIDLSTYGAGPNSIASYNSIVAVAVEANEVTDPGRVVFFDSNGSFLNEVTVGALPDMVTFTPDGSQLLVANEGEPSNGVNPKGSISLIDLTSGVASATVNTLDFSAFDVGQPREADLPADVIIAPGVTVAEDLEPEYVAVSADGSHAYVSLQENNAVAVVDLKTPEIQEIHALGFKDHSLAGNELDPSDRDGAGGEGAININNWPVKGIYMPDAISAININGADYYLTANEGDARDEDDRIGDLTLDPTVFPDAATLQTDAELGRLDAQTNLGDSATGFKELFIYGGRSFSVWNAATGAQVFDSGSEFAYKIAEEAPGLFNANNASESDFDERSDNKGAEPEAIITAEVNGRSMAFIGLERVGGVMVYDISEPSLSKFESFQPASTGDVAPEGLVFIPASDNGSGNDLLLVSYEDSGTIGVYRLIDIIFSHGFE